MDTTFAAIFIISINTGAYMAEIIRGGIVSVDKGQFEAAHAIGMTHWQTMTTVILPQAIRNILPSVGNELIVNIKDSSVLNVISVSELFFQAKSAAGSVLPLFRGLLHHRGHLLHPDADRQPHPAHHRKEDGRPG
ncbi:MAG: amino acid ABC transporter permease [Christensenellales bacterium]